MTRHTVIHRTKARQKARRDRILNNAAWLTGLTGLILLGAMVVSGEIHPMATAFGAFLLAAGNGMKWLTGHDAPWLILSGCALAVSVASVVVRLIT